MNGILLAMWKSQIWFGCHNADHHHDGRHDDRLFVLGDEIKKIFAKVNQGGLETADWQYQGEIEYELASGADHIFNDHKQMGMEKLKLEATSKGVQSQVGIASLSAAIFLILEGSNNLPFWREI